MANKVRHTLHRRSSVNTPKTINIERGKLEIKNPKAPLASDIEFGEIAINYGKDSESLFIKNSEGKVIRVNSIGNIRYDGDVDSSLEKYLDDRYVNRSGDTIYGDITIQADREGDDPKFNYNGTNFHVKSTDTSVSGTNLSITEDKSDIKSKQTLISGTNLTLTETGTTTIDSKTTIFGGEKMDYDVNRTEISGDTLIVNEKDTDFSGNTLDVIALTKATLSGNTLVVNEKNTDFNGTEFDADITNVNLSGNTLFVDEKDSITIKNTDITNKGKGFIKVQTPNLDIDSVSSTVDGEQLIINESSKINANSANVNVTGTTTSMKGTDLSVTYNNLTENITAKADVNIKELDADVTNANVSGVTLVIEEATKAEIKSPNEVHISGVTTNLDGTDLNVKYATSVNTTSPNVRTTASNEVKIDTKHYNLSGTTTDMSGDTLNIKYNKIVNVSGNSVFHDNVIVEKTFHVSGDTRLGKDTSTKVEVPNQNYPAIKGAPEFRLNDCTGKEIKVIGIQIGDYQTPNEKIKIGTPLEEILDKILCKTIGVIKHLPTVHMDNSGTEPTTYEVGTVVKPILSHVYSDGSFEGAEDLYIDENTGKRYSIPAQCKEGATTYLKNNNSLGVGVNTDSHALKEENVIYKCQTAYEQSAAHPIDTKGNYCTGDTAVIKAGVATSNSITYMGRYKYFLGYINKIEGLTSAEIRELTTKQGWVINNGDTTIVGGSPIVSNGYSIVIAVPEGYKLKTITNGLGANILPNFSTIETVNVKLQGAATKNYKVYIYPITNMANVEFKNVVIGK